MGIKTKAGELQGKTSDEIQPIDQSFCRFFIAHFVVGRPFLCSFLVTFLYLTELFRIIYLESDSTSPATSAV